MTAPPAASSWLLHCNGPGSLCGGWAYAARVRDAGVVATGYTDGGAPNYTHFSYLCIAIEEVSPHVTHIVMNWIGFTHEPGHASEFSGLKARHSSRSAPPAVQMFRTKVAPYPVERTLLVTGALDALMDSHAAARRAWTNPRA